MQKTTIEELQRIAAGDDGCGRRRGDPRPFAEAQSYGAVNVNRMREEQRVRLVRFLAQRARAK